MVDRNILVLEGGFNEEHEVSISTGNNVKNSLKSLKIKYDSILVNPLTFEKEIDNYQSDYLCFNALHGSFGEDGQIQKILDAKGFSYTHSNAETSSVAFNKILTKDKIKNNLILTPEYYKIKKNHISSLLLENFFSELGSYLIKPITSGSSYGIQIFKNKKDVLDFNKNLDKNLEKYKNYDNLLIEKYIVGKELTVAVTVKENMSFPVEVTEIIPKNEFFDYQSKYTPGVAEHILPAKIPRNIYEDCKQISKKIHNMLGCIGVSRSDFIYDQKNLYFLEINTQPGLTHTSLVPEQLKYHEISFDTLILNIIKSAK